jgi:hypothetical protein
MKTIQTSLKYLAVIALTSLAISCVSSTALKSKEDLAVAADFKVITPVKPDQIVIFKKLPVGQMTQISYGGKPYYVLRDSARNQAYVGGPKQYQVYQQLSQGKQAALNADSAEAVHQRDKKNSTDWAGYDGWDEWAGNNGQNALSNANAANGWY